MTKAERIRRLHARDVLDTSEIAKRIGCDSAYVRVVLRQRNLPGGQSKSDIVWKAANYEKHLAYQAKSKRKRWGSDPEFRERERARKR